MTRPKAPILALILAGGQGTRMVSPLGNAMGAASKPMQLLGSVRLIDRAIFSAQAQCEAVAINLHEVTAETQAPFAKLGLPLLADALPGHAGPLAGVLAGLEHAARTGFESLLSLPCDCPFLPDDLAPRLYNAARQTADGVAIAASGGRTHHVVALWPTSLREKLRHALVDEDLRKVGQFQQRYNCATVEWFFRERDPFFNVNTPEDLVQARDWLAHEQSSVKKLDLRGLKCPLPVLKTRKALAGMAPGERLQVACTDPLSVIDMPNLVRETGDALESQSQLADVRLFLIRKAGT